jgi:hypothetical protein
MYKIVALKLRTRPEAVASGGQSRWLPTGLLSPRWKKSPFNRLLRMSEYHAEMPLVGGSVNFLDATDQEITELVGDLLWQLRITTACFAMPKHERDALNSCIAISDECLTQNTAKRRLI